MEFTLSEAIARLAQEGLEVKTYQIHHAIRNGFVSRPRLTASHTFHFSDDSIAELINYFNKPRRPGRQPKAAVAT